MDKLFLYTNNKEKMRFQKMISFDATSIKIPSFCRK